MYSPAILYLSRGGDSFTLKASNNDTIHPYLLTALQCKTYRAVLKFLDGYYGDENCKTYHMHHPKYPKHSMNIGFGMVKGMAHECSVDNMILFVKQRIKEKQSPHGIFDKFGKIFGHTFEYLSIGTAVPGFGIIPGAIRACIGIAQVAAGIALMIIFAFPSLCSESAQIIVKRAIKHVGYGPLNFLSGIFQGVPFLGTWIYCRTH